MGNVTETTVIRRAALNADLWEPHAGLELEGSLAALNTLEAYWNASVAHPYFVSVRTDDSGLYDTLMHDLGFLLRQDGVNGALAGHIQSLIPDSLPNHNLALALDEMLRGDILDGFRQARQDLHREIISRGRLPAPPPEVEGLFSIFDQEIRDFRRHAFDLGQQRLRELGVTPAQSVASPHGAKSKAGRKPVRLPYETAQHAYWHVFDALEAAGETRRPSQQDVVDNLSESGSPVSKSTFGRFVKEWKEAGKPWPPPRPDTSE